MDKEPAKKITTETIFELYERLYFWEIGRRDNISKRIPVLLVIVLSLVSLQSFLIDKLLPFENILNNIIPSLGLGLSIIALVIGATYLVCSWHAGTYLYLPNAEIIENRRSILKKHYVDEQLGDDKDSWVAERIGIDLFEYYIESSSKNSEINKLKSKRLYIASNWLIRAIAIGLITFIILKVKEGMC